MTPRTPITGEEVADVLERAADLIAKPGAWTQGAFSRDANGEAELDEDNLATANPVCWCALGAIAQAANADPLKADTFALYKPETVLPAYVSFRAFLGGDVALWNDAPERQQSEVEAALRQAATAARQQGEGK